MISVNAIPVLYALEGESGQNAQSGTTHFGVTNTALEQYKKNHKKDKDNKINGMTLQSLDRAAAMVVMSEYFDYLEDQLNTKGNFYNYSKNERDGILLEVYNTGIKGSPRLVEAVRNGNPIEEVALAMLTSKDGKFEPNPNEDLSKYKKNKLGRLHRLYTEIKMMYNTDYSDINTREDLDNKRKEWDSTDMTTYIVNNLKSAIENRKLINERDEQVSTCISNYSPDEIVKTQEKEETKQPVPVKEQQKQENKESIFGNIGKIFMNAVDKVSSMFGGNKNDLQSTDKNAITNSAGEEKSGNTNINLQ